MSILACVCVSDANTKFVFYSHHLHRRVQSAVCRIPSFFFFFESITNHYSAIRFSFGLFGSKGVVSVTLPIRSFPHSSRSLISTFAFCGLSYSPSYKVPFFFFILPTSTLKRFKVFQSHFLCSFPGGGKFSGCVLVHIGFWFFFFLVHIVFLRLFFHLCHQYTFVGFRYRGQTILNAAIFTADPNKKCPRVPKKYRNYNTRVNPPSRYLLGGESEISQIQKNK